MAEKQYHWKERSVSSAGSRYVVEYLTVKAASPPMECRYMQRRIQHKIFPSAGLVIALLALAVGAQAQYVVSAKAGVIQFTAGEVFLDEEPVRLSKGDYETMENGQSLHTGRGFAELLLGANVYFRLGTNSLLKMYQNHLIDTQLALEKGSALVEVVEKAKGSQIRIAFGAGLVEIKKKGLYRLDAGTRELRVYGGEARVAKKDLKAEIKKGKMIRLDDDFKSSKFDADAIDPLHQWSALRSFVLFVNNPVARTQPHWMHISLGWVKNNNFGMSFHSQKVYLEGMRNYNARLTASGIMAAAAAQARQSAEALAARQANDAMLEQAKRAGQGAR